MNKTENTEWPLVCGSKKKKKRIIGKIGPELILEEPVRLKLLVERHFNKKK